MIIYRVRETPSGYFVDAKDRDGHELGTYLVTRDVTGYKCSCEAFQRSHNQSIHFHILVVKEWLKGGKSPTARYTKGKDKKIQVVVE